MNGDIADQEDPDFEVVDEAPKYNEEEMIRTLQSRMGMIPTVTQSNDQNLVQRQAYDAIPEQWTDEQFEEFQRQTEENPEPRDDSIPY